MSVVTLADHTQQLRYFARALGDCITDVRDTRAGIRLFYNLDFSLLCPLLFDRVPLGSKAFLTSVREGMERVMANATSEQYYGMTVSGPTVIEFFDQLDHLFRGLPDLQQRIPSLRNRYNRKDETILRGALKTSQEIRKDLKELSILTEKGQDQRIRGPINKFLHLLDSGAVCGIGDIIDGDFVRRETNTATFDRFVEEHNTRRGHTDSRSVDDRLFHYRIDAANICLTLAASKMNGVSIPFVTPTPVNIDACVAQTRTLARLDRTPLFLLNLHRLKYSEAPQIGDELNFLDSAAREAVALLEELQTYPDLDTVPNFTQVRLARFYRGPVALLDRGSRMDDTVDEHQLSEILEVLSDQTRIQKAIQEAAKDIRDGARLIELHTSRFDLPYIEEFKFDRDPVIERIRKDLDLRLRQ